MTSKEFLPKFFSTYIWGNVLAGSILIILLSLGVRYGIDIYTHHGESIVVPNVIHKSFGEATKIMNRVGLIIQVTDTGYVKNLPPDCILEQSPAGEKRVKSTHVIYVTINSASPPTLSMPDLIDNSSLREAQARLLSMGFKVGEPEYIPGEKDWIYGIIVNGKHVQAGDRISTEAVVILQVGDGTRSVSDPAMTNTSKGLEYEEEEVEEPIYEDEYEMVEVPVDENGNEITPNKPSSQDGPSTPKSQNALPPDPSSNKPTE